MLASLLLFPGEGQGYGGHGGGLGWGEAAEELGFITFVLHDAQGHWKVHNLSGPRPFYQGCVRRDLC